MRIVKEHDERKREIIDTAAALFNKKGYEQCSVNDILNAIGIAKGTFYHYFRSKEEVLNAVVDQTSGQIEKRIRQAAERRDLSPEDKLLKVFLAMRADHSKEKALIEEMHKTENALMHQKTLVSFVTLLTPILASVVEEGNRDGSFRCPHPEEDMQIFLASALTILDDGIFQVSPEKTGRVFAALIDTLERMLDVPSGQFLAKAGEHWHFEG